MRKMHIYNVGGEPYASAAEAVPAMLSGKPYYIVAHNIAGCLTCAVGKAIERTVRSLRYSLVKNIHASLLSAAVLMLMAWPLVYNAIPMPEIVVAARAASGACTLVGLLAALVAGLRIRRLNRATDFRLGTVVHKYDGLLPPATAWGKDRRRAAFPWLGLGLMLFSIALNCVVVADYARPAVLSDGTVCHSTSLAPPWVTWKTGIRYFEDSFFAAYHHDELADEFHVLRITYRVENTDMTTLTLPDWEAWLISMCSRMVNHATQEMPNTLPADATDDDTSLALAELFEYNEYKTGFVDALKTGWGLRYNAFGLKLTYLDYELLIVTRAEAVKDYERHKD